MKKPDWIIKGYTPTTFTWKLKYYRVPKLRWKDKFDTPRHEQSPQIRIEWLWFGIFLIQGEDDIQWEQWLWIHKYCGGDEKKAEETWPWTNMKTGKSSWRHYN